MRLSIALATTITLAACSSEDATMSATYVDAGGIETASEASVATDAHPTEDAAPEASQDAAETSTVDTSTKPPVCAPGKQEYCACVGGKPGAQICKDDGSGWEPCECPEAPDAGVDAVADTGAVDSGEPDAGADAAPKTIQCKDRTCNLEVRCTGPGNVVVSVPGCCTSLNTCGMRLPAQPLVCDDVLKPIDPSLFCH